MKKILLLPLAIGAINCNASTYEIINNDFNVEGIIEHQLLLKSDKNELFTGLKSISIGDVNKLIISQVLFNPNERKIETIQVDKNIELKKGIVFNDVGQVVMEKINPIDSFHTINVSNIKIGFRINGKLTSIDYGTTNDSIEVDNDTITRLVETSNIKNEKISSDEEHLLEDEIKFNKEAKKKEVVILNNNKPVIGDPVVYKLFGDKYSYGFYKKLNKICSTMKYIDLDNQRMSIIVPKPSILTFRNNTICFDLN